MFLVVIKGRLSDKWVVVWESYDLEDALNMFKEYLDDPKQRSNLKVRLEWAPAE